MSNNDIDEWHRHLLGTGGEEQPTNDRMAARLALVLLLAVVIFGFIVGASITSRRLHSPAEPGGTTAEVPAAAVAP